MAKPRVITDTRALERALATIVRKDLATIWPSDRWARGEYAARQRRLPAGAVDLGVLGEALRRLDPSLLDQRTRRARIPQAVLAALGTLGWHVCTGMWREPCIVRHDAATPRGYTRRERWQMWRGIEYRGRPMPLGDQPDDDE